MADAPPIVDISKSEKEAAKAIALGCEKWGFFSVCGHGVPDHIINEFDESAAQFFGLPRELKEHVRRSENNPRGWFALGEELTKQTSDYKEAFDCGADGFYEVDGENRWPENPSHFRSNVTSYYKSVENVSVRVAQLVALSLGLSRHAFDDDIVPSTSFLRLNHYPIAENVKVVDEDFGSDEPDADKDGVLSVNKHTDAGVLTVLRQRFDDPASLQVYLEESKRWVRVRPVKDAFTINVGDVLQVWSNDRYKSALHRVLANNSRPRFSAPLFLNPKYETVVSSRMPSEPAVYKPFTWKDFRSQRFLGDYTDAGEEIQIAHFKIPQPATTSFL